MRVFLALCAPIAISVAGCSAHSPTLGDGGEGQEVVLLAYPDGGPVEWDGWAGEFVADYCVECHSPTASCNGSGCHPSAGALPDFRIKADVVALATTIRCGISVEQDPTWKCGGTTPKEFPVASGNTPLPTDPQRGIIVGWIDAGCP